MAPDVAPGRGRWHPCPRAAVSAAGVSTCSFATRWRSATGALRSSARTSAMARPSAAMHPEAQSVRPATSASMSNWCPRSFAFEASCGTRAPTIVANRFWRKPPEGVWDRSRPPSSRAAFSLSSQSPPRPKPASPDASRRGSSGQSRHLLGWPSSTIRAAPERRRLRSVLQPDSQRAACASFSSTPIPRAMSECRSA